jgi:hypothetical protein
MRNILAVIRLRIEVQRTKKVRKLIAEHKVKQLPENIRIDDLLTDDQYLARLNNISLF